MLKVLSPDLSLFGNYFRRLPVRHNEEVALIRPFPAVTLSFRTLFLALLAIDLAFILCNVIAALAKDLALVSAVPPMLKITEDRSIPEYFNYLEWLVIFAGLLWLGLRDRWLAPLLWSAVFFLILIDDSFQVHEQIGRLVSTYLALPDFTLFYGSDIGEIIVFSAMGALAIGITLILLTRRDMVSRWLSRRYFLIVLALAFFGVGVDAMHSIIAHMTEGTRFAMVLAQLFGMIEDGGEMVIASLAVAMTLAPDDLQTRSGA